MRRTGGSRARRSTPTSFSRPPSRSRRSWSTRCATGTARLWGLVHATDMLVEITCGYTSPHEEEAGSAGLADRCRAIVRHRLPCLYRLVDDTTDDIVLSHLIWIVGQVEDDTTARRAFLEKVSHRELGKPSRNALHWCLVEEYGQDHQKGDQGPEHSEPH